MILFLYGPDTFRSREYRRESVKKFKSQRDPQGYNVVFLDGTKEKLGKIMNEINSLPFLAERRMIIIDNILSNNDKELLGGLFGLLEDKKFPDQPVVVFWQGEALSKIKEAKELSQLLAKEKFAQEFPLLVGAALGSWIQETVRKSGGAIEEAAVKFLIANTGHDMWQLHSLLNQLVGYAGGTRPVSFADVQLFVEEKVDDNIFTMVEQVCGGNKRQAFKLLAEQRRRGEEEGHIFGLIIWQFRVILEIADELERTEGLTSEVIAKLTGIHPFVVKKNMALAKKHSLASLHQLYSELLETDIATKTGRADQSLLIDLFALRR